MKFFHIGDLHFGKMLNGFSLLEDQEYFIDRLFDAVEKEQPDAILIAGDVFDRSQSSGDAKRLYDKLLCGLSDRKVSTFVISGNHDSARLIAMASDVLSKSGIFTSRVFDGELQCVSLSDEYGPVNVWLLPYVTRADIRSAFVGCEGEADYDSISSYTDAFKFLISKQPVDFSERNVIVAHQFLANASTSDSEVSVGTLDNIDPSVFYGFDYVAMGHIHRPQKIEKDYIRYAGSPLKYSKSEANGDKSICVIEIKAKGDLNIGFIPVTPRRDVRVIRGTVDSLLDKPTYEGTNVDDYIFAELEDETEVLEVMPKLRGVYPNIMGVQYVNLGRTADKEEFESLSSAVESKSPLELFEEFFELQLGKEMTGEQSDFMNKTVREVWEGDR